MTAQTSGGVAEVILVSGQVAGTAHVRAAITSALQQSVAVSISPGPANAVILGVDPVWVRAGGRVELTATVHDRFGNDVADGTIVSFAASRGQLSQKLASTQGGVALTWLTAPTSAGAVQVTADVPLSEIPTAFASVTVGYAAYLPLVQK